MNTRQVLNDFESGRRDFRKLEFDSALLTGLDLTDCDFDGSFFRRSRIENANLTSCSFQNVRFLSTQVSNTSFTRCSLNRALLTNVLFERAQLDDVSLEGTIWHGMHVNSSRMRSAKLLKARFSRCHIEATTFSNCEFRATTLDGTTFLGTDLSDICDSSDIRFEAACTIDWSSVCRSLRAVRLEAFLVASGMPELFAAYSIDCARSVDPQMIFRLLQSTFISYGAPDVAFARRLRDALQRSGVDAFFFERDAIPGMRVHQVMRDGVNNFDRVLLLCSEASLERSGVLNEIEQALAREARNAGIACLIPVTLDDYVFRWSPARQYLAQEVRERVVADFRGALTDSEKFTAGLIRLLKALKR